MSSRRILLADADAFYVSVARLVDPEGAGKSPLLIVGGSADKRGVVTSASYEARAYGVSSAMPMARAVRLCPDARVVPVPWEACVEKGEEIRAVLERFTPTVERASSDEFYLDLSGTERLYHNEPLAETARRIRNAVKDDTSLSVSIGGGTSKLVAKLAAGRAKPKAGVAARETVGVVIVEPGQEEGFLREFSLADLPGVGPRFQEVLARVGLREVTDALPHDLKTLQGWLGERAGAWLHRRIRGQDESPVDTSGEAKSISRDETFAKDLNDAEALDRELVALAGRASADLRASGLAARTVTVRIKDADFTLRQSSRTLPAPVISDRAVLRVARELLAILRKARHVPARLLGVGLSQLERERTPDQLTLFEGTPAGTETERDRTLSRMVDKIRDRFGPDAAGWGR